MPCIHRQLFLHIVRLSGQRATTSEQWTSTPGEPIAGLTVARTLIPNREPVAAVRVCNVTCRPIRLHSGQALGALQQVSVASDIQIRRADFPGAAEQRQQIIQKVDPLVPDDFRFQLQAMFNEYSDTFSYSNYDLGRTDAVQHEIITEGNRPFRQALRPHPRAHLPVIDKLVDEMQSQGVIEPCQSEWASNIVLVKKKDGSIRFCVDYRCLPRYFCA